MILTTSIEIPLGMTLESLLLFGVLLAFCIVLLVFVLKQGKKITELDKRLRKLMRGKNTASLESEIIHLFEANDVLTESAHDAGQRLDRQQKLLDTCFRKIGMIKYDAFNQMGGKLSFALALLNDENNGIILNSVHSPEGNYTYIKEVREGKSELELAEEEKQALDRALASAFEE